MRIVVRTSLTFFAVMIFWYLVALDLDAPLILPTPSAVWRRILDLWSMALWRDILSSFGKVAAVLGLVVLGGVPVGVILGLSDRIFEVLRPIFVALQAIPVVSWLALVVFSFGIGWRGPVLISTVAFLPGAIFTTVQGVHHLDGHLLEMARIYRVSAGSVFRDIVLGSLRPFVGAVVDATAGGAWKAVLVTEYLCGDAGLGVRLAWARQTVDVEGVYALSLIAVILGIATEFGVRHMMDRGWRTWRLS